MNGMVSTAPPGAMYVRALYDYEADDRTSLSFHEGDVMQVITQLESGWWDGVINGVRGWFPSNYCQIITSPDELPEIEHNPEIDPVEEELEDQDVYEAEFDEDDERSDHDDLTGLPIEGADNGERSRADFWIPQATPGWQAILLQHHDGRELHGAASRVAILRQRDRPAGPHERQRAGEDPTAAGDDGERVDAGRRATDSDGNSASELEGENIIAASRGSMVRHLFPSPTLNVPQPLGAGPGPLLPPSRASANPTPTRASLPRRRWTR